MISPVRNTARSGKAPPRLIGVVDRAIDAVAEAELARELDGQAAGPVGEVVGLDAIDEVAVVALGQHAGDGMLQVEAFPEDDAGHGVRS